MCARNECDNARLQRLTTNNYAHIHVFTKCVTSLSGFMCFVLILVFTLSLVSDVSSSSFSGMFFFVNFKSPRIRNSSRKFFSSGCCSPTLSCHRQLNLYPKFLHISHRENGSFEVLSLHSPSVTVDRRQLKAIRLRFSPKFCKQRVGPFDRKPLLASSFLTFCEFSGRPPRVLPLPPGRGRTRCRFPLFVLPIRNGLDLFSSSFLV